jgi:hypothetical protein
MYEIRSGRASKKPLNRVALAEALEFIITGISGAQGLFGVALCLQKMIEGTFLNIIRLVQGV